MDLARERRQAECLQEHLKSISKAKKDAKLRKNFGHEQYLILSDPCRQCDYDMRLSDQCTCAFCGAFN